MTNPAIISGVCAILDEGELWIYLRGITRRKTSVTMGTPADHRGRNKTGENVVARGFGGGPSSVSFTENGTDPISVTYMAG
jgi:hypothetical protein